MLQGLLLLLDGSRHFSRQACDENRRGVGSGNEQGLVVVFPQRSTTKPVCAIIGAGPGIDLAVAADVGVAPSAAYRHVRDLDHLVVLVAQAAREELAREMRRAIDRVADTGEVQADAVARLKACGRGYVTFAKDTPQLFRTAFLHSGQLPERDDDPNAEAGLSKCLDDLVAVGLPRPEHQRGAATIAWSAVHGLGSLLADQAMAVSFALSASEAIETVLDSVVRSVTTLGSLPGQGDL